MTHDDAKNLIGLYVLDELDAADRGDLEAHLQTCAICREELAAMRATLALLREGLGPETAAAKHALADDRRDRILAGAEPTPVLQLPDLPGAADVPPTEPAADVAPQVVPDDSRRGRRQAQRRVQKAAKAAAATTAPAPNRTPIILRLVATVILCVGALMLLLDPFGAQYAPSYSGRTIDSLGGDADESNHRWYSRFSDKEAADPRVNAAGNLKQMDSDSRMGGHAGGGGFFAPEEAREPGVSSREVIVDAPAHDVAAGGGRWRDSGTVVPSAGEPRNTGEIAHEFGNRAANRQETQILDQHMETLRAHNGRISGVDGNYHAEDLKKAENQRSGWETDGVDLGVSSPWVAIEGKVGTGREMPLGGELALGSGATGQSPFNGPQSGQGGGGGSGDVIDGTTLSISTYQTKDVSDLAPERAATDLPVVTTAPTGEKRDALPEPVATTPAPPPPSSPSAAAAPMDGPPVQDEFAASPRVTTSSGNTAAVTLQPRDRLVESYSEPEIVTNGQSLTRVPMDNSFDDDFADERSARQTATESSARTDALKRQLQPSVVDPEYVNREERKELAQARGKVLERHGQLMRAREQYEEVLAITPGDREATQSLDVLNDKLREQAGRRREAMLKEHVAEIEWTWIDPIPTTTETPGPIRGLPDFLHGANAEAGASGEQAQRGHTQDKLNSIIIPKIKFEDAPVKNVIEHLRQRAKELDPDGAGINIFYIAPKEEVALNAEKPADVGGGFSGGFEDELIMAEAPPEIEAGRDSTRGPTVTMEFQDIPLGEVIRYLTTGADAPLQFKVEDHAVVIAPPDKALAPMTTQFFSVPAGVFFAGETRNAISDNVFGDDDDDDHGMVGTDVRALFSDYGVRFPAGSNVSYNAQAQKLVVTNTTEELRKLERILDEIVVDPPTEAPEVLVEAKFMPVTEATKDFFQNPRATTSETPAVEAPAATPTPDRQDWNLSAAVVPAELLAQYRDAAARQDAGAALQALEGYIAVMPDAPNLAELQLARADIYWRQGDAATARKLLGEIAATWPESRAGQTAAARLRQPDGAPAAATPEAPRPAQPAVERDPELAPLPRPPQTPPPPVNPWELTAQDAESTFALESEAASWKLAQRFVRQGYRPPAAFVRMEEFVNAFDYHYPRHEGEPFAIHPLAAPSPFRPQLTTLRVGVKGQVIGRDQRRPSHLVFVIDASGSMDQPDRLPLVQRALIDLLAELGGDDRVTVVTCETRAHLLLETVPAIDREGIARSIAAIETGASTNLQAGIEMGMSLAAKHMQPGTNSRVVLCSDGVANVGAEDAEAILTRVADLRRQGVAFTSVGVGAGNYDDRMLEQLANRGDGVYLYLGPQADDRAAFVQEFSANLQPIAKDAKIQVVFNPTRVRRYRLIGYENRAIADKDFRNDSIDAGEIGSGQSATAYYELELLNVPTTASAADRAIGTVFVRYTRLDGTVEEIDTPLAADLPQAHGVEAQPYFYLGAGIAELAEILRGSPHVQPANLAPVQRLLTQVSAALPLDAQVRQALETAQRVETLPELR